MINLVLQTIRNVDKLKYMPLLSTCLLFTTFLRPNDPAKYRIFDLYFAPASQKKLLGFTIRNYMNPLLSQRPQTCLEFSTLTTQQKLSAGTKNKVCMNVVWVSFFSCVHLQFLVFWNKNIVVCCSWYEHPSAV